MAYIRIYPNHKLTDVAEDFGRMFQTVFGPEVFNGKGNRTTNSGWKPGIDTVETADDYIITMDLPGVEKKDVNINFEDGVLTVSGERKRSEYGENSRIVREERIFGSFNRRFKINGLINTDATEAIFKDGVLKIVLKKAEEAKPKTINIK